MCFNSQTSLATFLLSSLLSCYLIFNGYLIKNNNDVFIGILSFTIGIMQLLEYFIWNNLDCNIINHYLSLIIIFVLYLQPTISYFSYIYLFNNFKPFNKYFIYVILLYSLFIIYLLYYFNNNYNLCSKPSKKSCRLVWSPYEIFSKTFYNIFLSSIFHLFYFGIIFYIYSKREKNRNISLTSIFLPFTFVIAFFYSFYFENINFNDIFGSVWCFMAVFLPLIYIIKI